jgi:crotonobetainyl-CoA:carnitine CoA-transferase CaiB-like acyl-CoA transferase
MTTAGPLANIRVIEICHMLAGPYCGLLLADLGAEVIKVESGRGDIARDAGNQSVGDHNVYFASLNRNKQSVYLDLMQPADRARFEELVKSADALVTNLRPRAIRKLGLTYEQLRHLNDRLVCVALTGFGMTGPYSEYPAYDYIIQAMVGVMMLTGAPDGPPVRAGYSVVDNTGGMMAAIGLLARLVEGRGGQVDIALYDTLLSQLNHLAGAYLNSGVTPERHPDGAHAFFVPAQIFRTHDGHIAIFITHDSFWSAFVGALGKPGWRHDVRFATMAARSANRQFVIAAIQAELLTRSSEEWVSLLRPLGLVVAAIGTLVEALESENTAARDMVVTISTPDGPLRLVGNPIKIDGFVQTFDPPPHLGKVSGV